MEPPPPSAPRLSPMRRRRRRRRRWSRGVRVVTGRPAGRAFSNSSSTATGLRPDGVEERRGDRGAVTGSAMHPDLAVRHLGEPPGQLVDGDVDRTLDPGGLVLVGAADVENDDLAMMTDLREVGERGSRERHPAGADDSRSPALRWRAAAGRSIPIRTSSRCAWATSSAVSPQQGHRGAPVDEPADVGRERAVETEVQRAGRVAGRERGAVAQIDDPLAGLDPTAQLGRRQPARAGTGPGHSDGPAELAGAMCT